MALSIEQRLLSQPIISRVISQYLNDDDCWSCKVIFPLWDELTAKMYMLSESHIGREKELTTLLTEEGQGSKVGLERTGPTSEGGAIRILQCITDSLSGRFLNISLLNLSRQIIFPADYLKLFSGQGASCVFPNLETLSFNLLGASEEPQENIVMLPPSVKTVKCLILGAWELPFFWQIIIGFACVKNLDITEFYCCITGLPENQVPEILQEVTHLRISKNSLFFPYLFEDNSDKEKSVLPCLEQLVIESFCGTSRMNEESAIANMFEYKDISYVVIRRPWNLNGLICDIDGNASEWNAYIEEEAPPVVLNDEFPFIVYLGAKKTLDKNLVQVYCKEDLRVNLHALEGICDASEIKTFTTIEKIKTCISPPIEYLSLPFVYDYTYQKKKELWLPDFVTLCNNYFLPILSSFATSLKNLELSTQFCFGCCQDEQAKKCIKGLCGAFAKVTTLSIGMENKAEMDYILTGMVGTDGIRSFLEMFPNLSHLQLYSGDLVQLLGFESILQACPNLRKLNLECKSFNGNFRDSQDGKTVFSNETLENLVLDFTASTLPCDISIFRCCQGVRYLFLRNVNVELPKEKEIFEFFKELPHLVWLILISSDDCCALYCHREKPNTPPKIVEGEYKSILSCARTYPQLYEAFWKELLYMYA